jgi:hypothetical protein
MLQGVLCPESESAQDMSDAASNTVSMMIPRAMR